MPLLMKKKYLVVSIHSDVYFGVWGWEDRGAMSEVVYVYTNSLQSDQDN